MKEYLEKDIKYAVVQPPEKKKEVMKEKVITKKELEKSVQKIQKILGEIIEGTSDLLPYRLYLVKGTCPALSAFSIMRKKPSEQTIKTFIELSGQDFGWRVTKHFALALKDVCPKVTRWVED